MKISLLYSIVTDETHYRSEGVMHIQRRGLGGQCGGTVLRFSHQWLGSIGTVRGLRRFSWY